MTDLDFEQLKADWKQQDTDLDQLRQRLAWRQVRRRMFFAGEAIGLALGLGASAFLAWTAVSSHQIFPALASGALLAGVTLSARTLTGLLRTQLGPRAEMSTGRGAVEAMDRELGGLERIVRYWFWSALVLLGCAGLTLGLVGTGQIEAGRASMLATIWGSTALVLVGWGLWRRARIRRERAVIEALRREYALTDSE